MSRRPKLDYDFCPLPRKRHPAWAGVSLYVKGLMLSLFELADGAPITVEGDWLESLCKQMHINGRDRPNVRKALLELQFKGALKASSAAVSVAFFPHDQLTPIERPSDVHPTSIATESTSIACPSAVQAYVPLESNARNDSGHKTQTDRQTEETERERRERARESSARFEKPPLPAAPPELPPTPAESDSWLRVWALYAAHRGLDTLQLGHPARLRDALTAIAAAAEVEAGGPQGVDFDRAVQRLLGAWSADKWVKEKQPTIANLAANLHRYARARIAKVMPFPSEESLYEKQQRWEREAVACPPEWKIGVAE